MPWKEPISNIATFQVSILMLFGFFHSTQIYHPLFTTIFILRSLAPETFPWQRFRSLDWRCPGFVTCSIYQTSHDDRVKRLSTLRLLISLEKPPSAHVTPWIALSLYVCLGECLCVFECIYGCVHVCACTCKRESVHVSVCVYLSLI